MHPPASVYAYKLTCHSLLTTHYSLLTTHYSLLTTHYSLFTTHYSPPTTHYPLLTTHHELPYHLLLVLLSTHHSPLTVHKHHESRLTLLTPSYPAIASDERRGCARLHSLEDGGSSSCFLAVYTARPKASVSTLDATPTVWRVALPSSR